MEIETRMKMKWIGCYMPLLSNRRWWYKYCPILDGLGDKFGCFISNVASIFVVRVGIFFLLFHYYAPCTLRLQAKLLG
ncbi:hypothetical protein CISIN_1g043636mg [Citrus sinensis]|uniref:Uncharacterized protein n=1 Tax=Citrus sinensis TaxID=2711 RepID=A0A067F976_CITSI|nr:hypothetical protein CISIN_1g043636mg [Citrus sinensis]